MGMLIDLRMYCVFNKHSWVTQALILMQQCTDSALMVVGSNNCYEPEFMVKKTS